MYILGGLTAANAAFNCLVMGLHPAFKSGELRMLADPWASSKTAEQATKAYMLAHPELVERAARVTLASGGAAVAATAAGSYYGGGDSSNGPSSHNTVEQRQQWADSAATVRPQSVANPFTAAKAQAAVAASGGHTYAHEHHQTVVTIPSQAFTTQGSSRNMATGEEVNPFI